MGKKVCIINSNSNYSSMFLERGWELVPSIDQADLVQFTGGEDVTPSLYGEHPHPYTFSSSHRDGVEQFLFHECVHGNIPMAGICRGGQFLHVMNGGSMYQHSEGHGCVGLHKAFDVLHSNSLQVSSTHHQIMRRPEMDWDKFNILMYAPKDECVKLETVNGKGEVEEIDVPKEGTLEALHYPETRSLCFQPHPELNIEGIEDCRNLYFRYVNELLMEN